jgi:hypothetical protein
MTITPVFLLSAPRSGSTLVQRVLAAHDGVATVSEPWILLPILRPLHEHVPGAAPFDRLIHRAVSDFVDELPGGRAEYLAAASDAALRLYRAAAGPDASWFVDKSPVYHLVVDEIAEAFPDAPLVFLWRNPLAVVASAVQLWDGGRFQAPKHTMALFQSFEDLVEARRRHAARSYSVRFEDLVTGDHSVWAALMSYIGIPFESPTLERFADVTLRGRMGDRPPAGRRTVDRRRAEVWRDTLDSPLRRAWCRRYLRWLGHDRLAVMGYDLDELLAGLHGAQRGSPLGLLDDARTLGASAARDAVKRIVPNHAGDRSSWRDLMTARPREPDARSEASAADA